MPVNASTLGMAHSLHYDLIAQFRQDWARGICGTTPDTPLAEVERLHISGFNWPHPVWNGRMPNDGDLLELFCD